jgi:hypothetical protein
MAGKRFKIVDTAGHTNVPIVRYQTQANISLGVMDPGMLVKWASNGSPYVIPCVGTHAIGTAVAIVGLTASTGTHTAAADGYIDVYMPLPGVIYEGYASTASNIATQALLDAYAGDRVPMEISATTLAGDWTIDENGAEGQTNPFLIVGGDPVAGTIKFMIRTGATALGDQDLA